MHCIFCISVSDLGGEFINENLKKMLKQNNAYLFHVGGSHKAGMVERSVRTLSEISQSMLENTNRNMSVSDSLETILSVYNNRKHTGLVKDGIFFNSDSLNKPTKFLPARSAILMRIGSVESSGFL